VTVLYSLIFKNGTKIQIAMLFPERNGHDVIIILMCRYWNDWKQWI